jgi:kynurenine formamidase
MDRKRRRFVDLSIAIEAGLPSDPPVMVPKIRYMGHEEGAESMQAFFPGLRKEDLPGGLGWAVEFVELSTHSGTHLDAPWHYHPTMDGGVRAWTIDEIPLEWCMGDGVVLDFRHLPDGYRGGPEEVEKALGAIPHELHPLDIVLAMTNGQWETQVLANYMYDKFFRAFDVGVGSAAAMIIMLLVTPILIWNVHNVRKEMK